MTRIMILEDSEDSLKALTVMIENVSNKVVAVPVKSLEEAREVLQNTDEIFQAFLLDINLCRENCDDTSGITLAREIRQRTQYAFTPIIMITSLANLELQAYRELHCYQYILKPYAEEDIIKLIKNLLFQMGETGEPFILVKKDGINYKIFCKDIVYIKAVPRGVSIVLAKEEMKIPYTSIRQLMEKLSKEQFFQCHRMYVINRNYIDYVDMVNGIIKLTISGEVEIGVTYKNEIRRRINGGNQ